MEKTKDTQTATYWGGFSIALGMFMRMTETWFDMPGDATIYGPIKMSHIAFAVGGLGIASEMFVKMPKLEKTLLICGLQKKYDDKIHTPKIRKTIKEVDRKIYHLTLPVGLCKTDFENKREEIEQALNKEVDFAYKNNRIIMTVIDKRLETTYPFEQKMLKGDVPIVIGHTLDGIKTIDLANSPSPHLGIYGETNSGKSVILRGALTQLILNKTQEELQMHLIDLKRVELSIFKRSNIVKSFSNDIEQAEGILKEICDMTDKRYKMLEQSGKVGIKGYNKTAKNKLPYILCVIDEFTDLMDSDKSIEYIYYIARKARAVGIHLILTTQRPDVKSLDSRIKSNVGNIMGLKTTTAINSGVIIDKTGLEKLRGYGHGLYKMGSEFIEFQSEFLDEDHAKKLIKHTFKNETITIVKTPKIEPQAKKARGVKRVG